MKQTHYGVVNGRFHPFHHGHAEYFRGALDKCDCLIVGITNADPSTFEQGGANPHRGLDASNPMTFFERYEAITAVFSEWGLGPDRYRIVPFPIHEPELIKYYAPHSSTIFFTVYDEWGSEKIERVRQAGFDTCVLWTRPPEAKLTTGSEIRRRIACGEIWEHLVPRSVYRYMVEHGIDERIREGM